jgi:hypothetical protein
VVDSRNTRSRSVRRPPSSINSRLLLTGTQDEHDGGVDGEDVRA